MTTILEALDMALGLLQQDGWDDGDLIYQDLEKVIKRLREKHPKVAKEDIDEDP